MSARNSPGNGKRQPLGKAAGSESDQLDGEIGYKPTFSGLDRGTLLEHWDAHREALWDLMAVAFEVIADVDHGAISPGDAVCTIACAARLAERAVMKAAAA